MSECIRYRRKDIQTHLAQQYVLGHLSVRVKKRTDALMKQDAELEKIVYRWQGHFSSLIDLIPEEQPPARVWNALQHANTSKVVAHTWLSSLWRYAGVVSFLMLGAVSLLLWQQSQQKSVEREPGYLAIMSESLQPRAAFVLTAYKGEKPGQSILKLQWAQAEPKQDLSEAVLWAVERDTGKRLTVGTLTELTHNKFLTKEAWLKIKGSAELEISIGDRVVYRGACLQLAAWQKS